VLGARYRRHFLLETLEQRDDARPLSDSLYPGFPIRDPDLNPPFQVLHQTYRNSSYALHHFDECLVPKLSPLMLKIAAILNHNTDNLATPPPPSLDDGCVYQLSLPPLRTRQPNRDPLAEPDVQRNSTQKLPALQVTEPSQRLPPQSSSFGVASVAGSQPNPRYRSSTPPLHATSNTEISIYSCTATAEQGSFDARRDPASACPSLQEDFSTTSLSLISGQEPTFLLPSATLPGQTDSIKQQHPPYAVEAKSFCASRDGYSHLNLAIDFKKGSKTQDEKRKRNRAASKRYRARKSDWTQELEASVEELKRERDFYRGQCCFYYGFIVDNIGSHMLQFRH
jgi:hypothetical protein